MGHRGALVTGIGMVTPLGLDREESWTAMLAGRSAVRAVRYFDPRGLDVRIGGEVPADEHELARRFRETCRLPFPQRYARFTQLALLAGADALRDAGLERGAFDPHRAGVSVGVAAGSFHYLLPVSEALREQGAPLEQALDHNFVVKYMPNAAAAHLTMWLGIRGPSANCGVACATGAQSIALALEWIRAGVVDVALAGGADSTVNRYALHAYHQIGALSTRNDEPERASRPFSAGRDGFVMAEGAAVLVLESEAHARARGARAYARLLGQACTSEAYNVVAPRPEGEGMEATIRAALQDAGVEPAAIDYVSAHGTSTPLNDVAETRALRRALGRQAERVAVSSQKSMIGHAIGATSAIEAGVTALSVHEGRVTPTINLDEPDPACDLDYVSEGARTLAVRCALSNAFGFGGHNCCLVFGQAGG